MRHRLEFFAVQSVASAVRRMSPSRVRGLGQPPRAGVLCPRPGAPADCPGESGGGVPARSLRERRQLARQTFGHFGRLLFELLKFSTLPDDRKLALVELEGEDRVRLAYAHGRGVLFFTGHFGFWELQAIAHALKFEPMAVLARALDNPQLHELLEQVQDLHRQLRDLPPGGRAAGHAAAGGRARRRRS